MRRYRARDSDCPSCGRTPNVRFSGHQVRRCKRDRAAGHHTEVSCERCGRKYWIRNLQIADAEPENTSRRPRTRRSIRRPKAKANGARPLPDDFPWVAALREAEIETVGDLDAVDELAALPGVGEKTAARIREARAELDR